MTLQADGVARFEAPRAAAVSVPPRANIAAVTEIGRVEAEPGNHGKGVSAPRINCDPSSAAALPKPEKIARRKRLIQDASVMQRE